MESVSSQPLSNEVACGMWSGAGYDFSAVTCKRIEYILVKKKKHVSNISTPEIENRISDYISQLHAITLSGALMITRDIKVAPCPREHLDKWIESASGKRSWGTEEAFFLESLDAEVHLTATGIATTSRHSFFLQ